MAEKMTGGCHCGAVPFETGPSTRMLQCHCRDCQKISGGGPSNLVGVEESGFRVTRGEPGAYTVTGTSGKDVIRYFCSACGTPLHSRPTAFAGAIFVKAGAFDDSGFYAPTSAVYTGSAPTWHVLPEGLQASERG